MERTYEKIPAEIRWKIAAQAADYFPYEYDEKFRVISAGRCDGEINEAESEIWKEAGKKQRIIADELNFRLEDSYDVAMAYTAIASSILGPETEIELIKESGDCTRITTNSCPMLRIAIEKGTDTQRTEKLCMDYSKAAVNSLNPDYRIDFNRNMCNGDISCEIVIRKR
ncbi:hypothetical protein F1737_10105 [Methanoplanus sp. FWC-SCC4]|uniref:L-2-amino-thiazoline-4-carboxylic acid hydrolase n=1 Tax=Methanochimaera problematica TaxID=2609417 RepID=A0AA97FCK7_9EURY|nr:hypothetical protein [Methanoplanus sp. FWC-SCC4]WOF17005.1 hypothetical protein F1737_10105 [Methanoplanus sp. FWC-SCC4]